MEKKETMTGDIKLENWMTNLPGRIRNIPLIYLAIPGKRFT